MQLSESDATATIPVKRLDTASKFYEGVLGLKQVARIPGAITYRSGRSDVLVYESQFAGTNKATTVTWTVGNVEALVQSLKAKGIRFEHYDLPNTRREGDVHIADGVRVAWFKDPDGNIISLVNQ